MKVKTWLENEYFKIQKRIEVQGPQAELDQWELFIILSIKLECIMKSIKSISKS